MPEPAPRSNEETVEFRLAEVLEGYCAEAGRGGDPDPESTLKAHPELAGDLAECLEGLAAMEELRSALLPEAPAPSLAGRRLGDFELLEELGRGGMGVVYKARQVSLDRLVALKMIRSANLTSKDEAHRFRNEAALVARLDHPAIVPVYEVGEHDGQLFYIMKLIDGGSLSDQLDRFRADPRAAATLLLAIARAVNHAHQRGVLHRDLKPSNILVDREGQPHVTDFGLAKRLAGDSNLTRSGDVLGTPSYMAPEQASGHKGVLTTATDVYGLGGILYAMLTGRPPCVGESLLETLDNVRDCAPQPPSGLNRLVDRDLETICLKCLEKEPERRYGSAEALARDLERWLAGLPIKARPVSRLERLWRWCQRHPVRAGAVVAAAALLLAVTYKAFAVARERADRLEKEVLRSNAYAAQGVASLVLWELERLSLPVARTAESGELRRLLAAGDRAGLAKFLASAHRMYDQSGGRWTRPGEPPPFLSWYVLDAGGHMLGLVPAPGDRTLIGRDFSGRDYFHGALLHAGETGRSAVHISRAFLAENLGMYKVAISAPVRSGPEPASPVLGVLAATITTTRTLGSLRLDDDEHTAVLVARKDTSPPRGQAPEHVPEEYVILLHPEYSRGEEAISLNHERLRAVRQPRPGDEFQLPDPEGKPALEDVTDRWYTDPAAARKEEFGGRWLAAFAPVGNTEFVVIVQQRYADLVTSDQKLFRELLLWAGGAALVGLAFIGVVLWSGFSRAPRQA
jgi:serine/threonine-protein kinase